ncbi:hypothetical protein SAMN05421810_11816 [Amycolatopsis arida]|uniref:Uncharacterized protein n=1 Tax=Amycolatopsis arida TaxID=587909 RepID=A0A1I6B0Z4_9PSEU|nr:hypothetical protein [Amycolatopsis arida]TDX83580.1 hypothetical protein CLV69_11914 [Amycolatopsis arida]SFQ74622.1 hypothetical protein SAMN05421810_11816 [Amycolatopsis arida]
MPLTDPQHARLFLLYAAEPPAPALHDFVAAHGPVAAVERIRAGTAPPAVLAEITRPSRDWTTPSARSTPGPPRW